MRLLAAAAAAAALAAGLLAESARATPLPPAPTGEDIAFIQIGTVGERVSIDFYRAAAKAKALTAGERQRLLQMGKQKAKRWAALNALLGEDAIGKEDFVISLPDGALDSPKRIARFGERLERLLVGVYLSGVQSAEDPPTRLLLGQQLAIGMQNLAWFRALRDVPGYRRVPRAMSVEYAGIQFDQFLATPGVEPS